jgi:hypothetical protein
VHPEDFFQAAILRAGLLQMLFEAGAQLGRGRLPDHHFQLLGDLALGIVDLLEDADEQIVERLDAVEEYSHEPFLPKLWRLKPARAAFLSERPWMGPLQSIRSRKGAVALPFGGTCEVPRHCSFDTEGTEHARSDHSPGQLSRELREGTGPDLSRRRWAIGLSFLAAAVGAVVGAYQTGLIRRLPDIAPAKSGTRKRWTRRTMPIRCFRCRTPH